MKSKEDITVGVVLGIAITLLYWAFNAYITEYTKVRDGYLTFRNKTYTVTLYDTLDTPEKESK